MVALKNFDWLVIGAGPAGIGAVGKLLDHGVPAQSIGWVDPAFKVGDLGAKWYSVPSNTKVDLFLRFLKDCKAFEYDPNAKRFPLDAINPEENCYLKEIATPLQWVTDHLRKKVSFTEGMVLSLRLEDGLWRAKTENTTLLSKCVILANGSDSKVLSYPTPSIPLEVALNPEKLLKTVGIEDSVAVFGSSHSAVLILANLLQTQAKRVYNFYRSPHLYAVYFDDWILFDDTGLKGFAANWARQNLDGKSPERLKRVLLSDPEFEESLALCNKLVHAVGFEPKNIPVIEQYPNARCNEATGIIAPRLFGLGIAYPQMKFDRLGNKTYRVGLWKFMEHLNENLPTWFKYAGIN